MDEDWGFSSAAMSMTLRYFHKRQKEHGTKRSSHLLTVQFPTTHNYIQQPEILVTALVYAFLSLIVNRMCKEIYSQTRLYDHPRITDNLLWPWGKKARYIFSKFNPLNMDTLLIQTLSMAPLVLEIFQLKVRRPCNADATQTSLFLNVASSMVQ